MLPELSIFGRFGHLSKSKLNKLYSFNLEGRNYEGRNYEMVLVAFSNSGSDCVLLLLSSAGTRKVWFLNNPNIPLPD